MNMKNKEKKTLSVVAFVALMAFILVAFAGVMKVIEMQLPDEPLKDGFLENSKKDDFARQEEKEPTQVITLDDKDYNIYSDIETYLFMGTDYSGNEKAKDDEYQGTMADFLLLAMFDKTEKTYGFIQLNRDTMTEITLMQADGSGYASAEQQLCTAHWYGGNQKQSAENTAEAVSTMLGGLKIDGYYVIGMDEIPAINDYVGGVSVKLEEDFTKKDPSMKKGKDLTLTGKQAYIYIHDRYGVGDETNISRMARQKQYMDGLFEIIKEKASADKKFGTALYKKFRKDAETNIKLKWVLNMANYIKEGQGQGVLTFEGESKIGKALGDGIEHAEFYPKKDSIEKVLTRLTHMEAK